MTLVKTITFVLFIVPSKERYHSKLQGCYGLVPAIDPKQMTVEKAKMVINGKFNLKTITDIKFPRLKYLRLKL